MFCSVLFHIHKATEIHSRSSAVWLHVFFFCYSAATPEQIGQCVLCFWVHVNGVTSGHDIISLTFAADFNFSTDSVHLFVF